MLNTYYTLAALAPAWHARLAGLVVAAAYSQERAVLTLAFAGPEDETALRASVRPGDVSVLRTDGARRARRNTATLFESLHGRAVAGVRVAERDRHLYLDLVGGGAVQLVLFGPRPNVFLVDAQGTVEEAFQADDAWRGRPAPLPRPAPVVDTFEAFAARWDARRRTTAQALAAAFPLFDALLAEEALARAGPVPARPADCTAAHRQALFAAGRGLIAALATPRPHVYFAGRFADAFSLVPLEHRAGRRAEAFDAVDEAVRFFVRRRLAEARFRARYEPLARALDAAAVYHRAAAERMLDELSRPSRADRYERWGHLLMAAPAEVPPGAERVTLPDLFEGGQAATIVLDPARSAVENAQHYYERARRTREARQHAERRLLETEARAHEAAALREALAQQTTAEGVARFAQEQAGRLAPLLGAEAGGEDRLPFRRFSLGGGYEVWVGRNARQNDALTMRYARKDDLWMHARGVPGSHAVLRLPGRQVRPGRDVLERAAAIAAYFSKARGSSLVPVIVVPRKYVRKPRGAAPGAVVVEREEVLLVPPALPDE